MKRKTKLIAWGIVLTSFASIFVFIFFGIGKYIEVITYVDSLNESSKALAKQQLRNYRTSKVNSGIFSQKLILGNNLVGIWTMNLGGLKFYRVDKSTKLSSLSLCKDDRWKSKQQNLSKNVNMNYKEWVSGLRQGDYMQIILNSGSTSVAEIISYDWWAFSNQIPVNYFQDRCSK